MKKTLDIVTSAYNEEIAIPILYNRICETMSQEANYEWRMIICDNVSTDSTWKCISEIAKKDSRIVGVKLSRNFAFDSAITCGLDLCEADAVVVMCSDLQDPPELLNSFLRHYENGYEQVVAKITEREGLSNLRQPLVKLFYFLAEKASNGIVRNNVSDFRLMSKKVYKTVNTLRESKRFMRGLMSWPGFKTKEIEIVRPPRMGGESKFAARKLIGVIAESFESILAFSTIPLRIISLIGIISSIFSVCLLFSFVILAFTKGVPFAGFGTIVSLLLLAMSLILMVLGVLGSYIGLIYEETKGRPTYVIDEIIMIKDM